MEESGLSLNRPLEMTTADWTSLGGGSHPSTAGCGVAYEMCKYAQHVSHFTEHFCVFKPGS